MQAKTLDEFFQNKFADSFFTIHETKRTHINFFSTSKQKRHVSISTTQKGCIIYIIKKLQVCSVCFAQTTSPWITTQFRLDTTSISIKKPLNVTM